MTARTSLSLTGFDRQFFGGEFVSSSGGELMDSVNPATGAVWVQVPAGTADDASAAVEAANRAFRHPDWNGMTGGQRARLLMALADILDREAEALAVIESTDNGKPISLCRGDIAGAAMWLRYYAGLADKLHGEYIPFSATERAYTFPHPLGVVAAIIPWNSPILLAAWKLAPALAAGNTIVLKPSELASASCFRLAEFSREAGFPPGVINVISGTGVEAGEALVRHPDVAKISFTGSDVTARRIGRIAAEGLKPTTMECGGKAPFIVFSDADIADAAEKAVQGMFVNAGQQCTVASRVLVQSSVYDEFLDRYLTLVGQLPYGDPADPKTIVGAIVSPAQLARINRYIEIARQENVTFLAGEKQSSPKGRNLEGGYWVRPTVLTGVQTKSLVFQDEIFGPVVVIQSFDDEDEAVELANSVRYGLVSGVFTNDIRRAHRVAERLSAGIVWVNTYRKIAPSFPYGGFKDSGLGRENGLNALRAYTQTKSVILDR